MRVTVRALAAIVALTAGAVAAGCDVSVKDGDFSVDLASGRATDDLHRTYTLTPDGEIEIDTRRGSIEVTSSEGTQLEVTISRQARARSDDAAQALLKQIEIREDVAPERVRLRTEAPRDGSVQVRYVVRAPKSLATVLKIEDGSVRIDGMAGRVRANVSNGPIAGKGLAGAVQASTVNGPVGLELATVSGEVNLVTVNGPIRLTIPATAKADFSARVINGRIATSGLTFEDLDRSAVRAGQMKARLNGGGPRVRLETTNGPIVISGRSVEERGP